MNALTPESAYVPRSRELTERQEQVLKIIRSHVAEHGFPPSYRELALALGIQSTQSVFGHLRALEKKGYLERGAAASARSLKPVTPVLPLAVIPGTPVDLCTVLDRLERRLPNVDYVAVRRDLATARGRIDNLLARLALEEH